MITVFLFSWSNSWWTLGVVRGVAFLLFGSDLVNDVSSDLLNYCSYAKLCKSSVDLNTCFFCLFTSLIQFWILTYYLRKLVSANLPQCRWLLVYASLSGLYSPLPTVSQVSSALPVCLCNLHGTCFVVKWSQVIQFFHILLILKLKIIVKEKIN